MLQIRRPPASVLRAPVQAPAQLRIVVIPVIGVMLGSAITPALFAHAGQWVATLVLMPVFLATAGFASISFYRRVGGYDATTAYFAAMPGGLNDMMILGGEAGGDERRIALAHSSRILLVVLFVGFFYGYVLDIRAGAGTRAVVAMSDFGPVEAAILLACAVAGVPLARWLRLPAAPMLGPMILSGAVHLAGVVSLPPPSILVIIAQIVLGTIIGCRFVGVSLTEVGRNLALGAVSSFLMLIVATGFAAVVARLGGIDVAQVFLAYSPGGLTEMSLLAIAMGQEPAYVSLSHLARIMLVIFGAPIAARLLGITGRR